MGKNLIQQLREKMKEADLTEASIVDVENYIKTIAFDYGLVDLESDEDTNDGSVYIDLYFDNDVVLSLVFIPEDDGTVSLYALSDESEESITINGATVSDDGMIYIPDINVIPVGWITAQITANVQTTDAYEKEEAFRKVVRRGKIYKKLIRRKRRRPISSKRRAALAKARRKAHTSSANRNRRKSGIIRKRRNL